MKNVYTVWVKDILQYFKQLKIKIIFKLKFPNFDGQNLYLYESKIKNLPDLPNLKLLYLEYSNIETLSNFPNLMFLNLGECKIKTIPSFPKLRTLDLCSSNIQFLPDLPDLEVLYLGNSDIEILGDFPKLRRLYLESSLIKDHGNFIFSNHIGSRYGRTIYDKKYDKIFCGCFKGTLDEFIDKVHEVYPEEHIYRKEYDQFIDIIKSKI